MKITVYEFFDRCSSYPETVTIQINGRIKRLDSIESIDEFVQQYGNKNINDFEIYHSMNGFSIDMYIS